MTAHLCCCSHYFHPHLNTAFVRQVVTAFKELFESAASQWMMFISGWRSFSVSLRWHFVLTGHDQQLDNGYCTMYVMTFSKVWPYTTGDYDVSNSNCTSSSAITNHSSSQKPRLNDLSYGIKIWTDLSYVLSQSTRLTQTDRKKRCTHHITG